MTKRTKLDYVVAAGLVLTFISSIVIGAIKLGAAEEKLNRHDKDLTELKEQTKDINRLKVQIQGIDERTIITLRLVGIQDQNLRLLFRSLTNRDLPERGDE